MPDEKPCPTCGKSIAGDALMGLCPDCLLQAGFGTLDPENDEKGKPLPFTSPKPEELARYFPELEVLELLGRGGMGAVYKARQRKLDRLVALKILPPDVGRDPSFADRFEREARALAQLHHPNIVTLYDSGQIDGLFYFFMEFVDGVNLRRLLDAGHVFPREALAIVPQICDALQFAHDRGIIHRDIKPENILLNKAGDVKIADFGLAKIVAHDWSETDEVATTSDPEHTEAGKVMGTPRYMAPEQLSHPLEVDNRVDIYALGVVFYQMLTGELPSGKFAPPSRKVRIDVRLDEVVLRALEKEPERRYQQVSAIKTHLETIAQNRTPSNLDSPSTDPRRLKRLLLILVLVLVAAFILLGALGATLLLLSSRRAEANLARNSSADHAVLEAELQQAKAVAAQQEREYAAGVASQSDAQASNDKVEMLEAELTGDPIQIARTRFLIAQRQFKMTSNLYQAGISDTSDYQKAAGQVSIAEALWRALDPKAADLEPEAIAVTCATVSTGDIEDVFSSLGAVASSPTPPSGEQVHHIPVTFTIPDYDVQTVVSKFDAKQPLPIVARSRDNIKEIGEGFLVAFDNQIDATTGTLTCKGMIVSQRDTILLPNMMLNIILTLETRHGVTLAPTKAVEYGQQGGAYVYLVKTDHTVTVRWVTVGTMAIRGDVVEIKQGLSPGDLVVLNPPNGLREGSRIR